MNLSELFPTAVDELKNRDRELLAISKCVEASADLLVHNWNAMRDRQGHKMKVAITYTVELTGKQNEIKTVLSYAERHTDEREDTTEDPEQSTLPLDPQPEPAINVEAERVAPALEDREQLALPEPGQEIELPGLKHCIAKVTVRKTGNDQYTWSAWVEVTGKAGTTLGLDEFDVWPSLHTAIGKAYATVFWWLKAQAAPTRDLKRLAKDASQVYGVTGLNLD